MSQMRGQQQIITPVLLTGILIAIIGSVYLWGAPLIEKNRDMALLRDAEDFVLSMNERIKMVANTQGRDAIRVQLPILVKFNEGNNELTFELTTKGSIYSVGRIYFVRNESEIATWGRDDPALVYVDVGELDGAYFHRYTLRYRQLNAPTKAYMIKLVGKSAQVGRGHWIYVEYKGVEEGGNLVKTLIEVRLE